MLDIDFRQLMITLILLGAVIDGAVVAHVLLA